MFVFAPSCKDWLNLSILGVQQVKNFKTEHIVRVSIGYYRNALIELPNLDFLHSSCCKELVFDACDTVNLAVMSIKYSILFGILKDSDEYLCLLRLLSKASPYASLLLNRLTISLLRILFLLNLQLLANDIINHNVLINSTRN